MHSENASGPDPRVADAAEPELVARLLLVVLDAVVVAALAAGVDAEVPALTRVVVGLAELPPQPATSIPLRSAAAVSAHARARLIVLV
jgi:hypothetical protein